MKTDEIFKHIEHQFNPWHVAKRILKKIMQSAATKGTHYISALLCLAVTKSYVCSNKPVAESFC